jgi:hypothetical protein
MNIISHSQVVDWAGGKNATKNGEKKTIKRYEGEAAFAFLFFFQERV